MLNTVHPAEVPVYPRLHLQPERGAGSTLVAEDGRRFLDLYGGHAVAVSGHCHPRVVAAVCAAIDFNGALQDGTMGDGKVLEVKAASEPFRAEIY